MQIEDAALSRAAAAARLTRQAWADFLEQYAWHHYVTLTSQPTAPDRLRREFLEGFVRRLTRATQGPVTWFYALEHGSGGCAHLHALLSGTAQLSVLQIARAWPLGFAHVLPYDPAQGAAFYLSKSMLTPHADYDISRRPPDLRERAAASGAGSVSTRRPGRVRNQQVPGGSLANLAWAICAAISENL